MYRNKNKYAARNMNKKWTQVSIREKKNTKLDWVAPLVTHSKGIVPNKIKFCQGVR